MKRFILGGISLAAALIASATQAQEFRLNWGHYLNNSPYVQIEKDFAAAVEKRSNGRVAFNIVYSGGLGKGDELLPLAGRGGVDIAAIVPGYYADQLLYAKTLQIPFVFRSPAEAIKIANYSYENIPAFSEELSRLGVRRLFHQPLGSYYFTGKTDDCKSLDRMNGKKIRTFGTDIPKMMTALGGVPVSILPADLYEALERGTLDYSFVNIGNVEAFRLYEVAKFSCGPGLSMAGHMIVMSERTWQRLPEDIQKIITEEAAIAQQRYVEWVDEGEAAAAERMKKAGAVIIEYSPETLAEWKSKTPDLLQAWVDDMAKRGHGETAAQVAAKWRELTAN